MRHRSEVAYFQPTSWTVVEEAQDKAGPAARAAYERLAAGYWKPTFFFLRKRGLRRENAEDATQDFFAYFFDRDFIQNADPAKGKFRTFIIAHLENFLANQRRNAHTVRRGKGTHTISADFGDAEQELSGMPASIETADAVFLRSWALETMAKAWELLRLKMIESGEGHYFGPLHTFFNNVKDRPTRAQLEEQLGLSYKQVDHLIDGTRKQFKDQLRLVVRPTVENESEVKAEIVALFDALGATQP